MNLHSNNEGVADKKQAYKLCKLKGARSGRGGRVEESSARKGYWQQSDGIFGERKGRWVRWTSEGRASLKTSTEHKRATWKSASKWLSLKEKKVRWIRVRIRGVAGGWLREEARDPSNRALWGVVEKRDFILNEVDTVGEFWMECNLT